MIVDEDRAAVSVPAVDVVDGVAGEMDLAHRGRVERVEPRRRVAAEVGARDVDVVDIAQQPAARPPRERAQELRLGNRRVTEAEVSRRVLDEQGPTEPLLRSRHVRAEHLERFLGVR